MKKDVKVLLELLLPFLSLLHIPKLGVIDECSKKLQKCKIVGYIVWRSNLNRLRNFEVTSQCPRNCPEMRNRGVHLIFPIMYSSINH